MARQRGHIKYQGTIGEIRHFKIKGMDGYYAGLKGGPTAKQIKNAPEFARTRENMSEFGGAAKIAKVMRTGLGKGAKAVYRSVFHWTPDSFYEANQPERRNGRSR
jgi:hypothetical protein